MSRYNKVVWSEGLFLHPQLFQQQERYLEYMAHARALPLSPFFWGCTHVEVDTDSLPLGKVALRRVSGLFQDGTPFDAPAHALLPEPCTITPEHVEHLLYVTLPMRLPHAEEITFTAGARSQARYTTFETDIADTNSMGMEPQTVQLARLRLCLTAEQALTDNVLCLAVARVAGVGSNGEVYLDPDFIPPCPVCSASEKLMQWLTELHALVRFRAEVLAEALVGANTGGPVSEITDYLLLQTLNRHEPLLGHLVHTGGGNPEALHCELLAMAGELSTFLRFQTRRPADMPPYRHDQPGLSVRPLVEDLRLLLNIVLERCAQNIPLQKQAYGRYFAVFTAGEVEQFSSLVLCVSARMSRELLQHEFLAKTKIGPPEQLDQLVRSHVPGVLLELLALAPRQMPFKTGSVYFELRREGAFWERIRERGGMGLQVVGEFPGLEVELWGMRER